MGNGEDIGKGKGPPSDFLKKMDYLRRLISKYEDKGVNVKRAWYLFNRARDLSHKPEEALDLVARARGDLSYKRKLFRWSTGGSACWFSAIAVSVIVILPVSLWLICDYLVPCLPGVSIGAVILGIPVFLLKWGYIGAAAYVLFSIGKKIASRLLDPHEAPAYLFRLVLGCVFAGVLFYVFQLGFLSLPGYAGEEVAAALERAGTLEEYREKYLNMEKLNAEVESYTELYNEFEEVEGTSDRFTEVDGDIPFVEGRIPEVDKVVEKANYLIDNKHQWEALVKTIKIIDIIDSRNDYRKAKVRIAVSVPVINESLETIKTLIPEGEEYSIINAELEKVIMSDDVAGKEGFVSKYKLKLTAIKLNEISDLRMKGALGLIEEYSQEYNKGKDEYDAAKYTIDNCFETIKETVNETVETRNDELAKVKEAVNKSRYYIESVELEIDYKELQNEVEALLLDIKTMKKELADIDMEIARIETESPDVFRDLPEYKAKIDERDYIKSSGLDEMENEELPKKEQKLEDLESQLKEAYKRERGKPIWESAFFIVLAFFAGFSVNFVNKIFDRAMRGILDIKSVPEEPEGEAGGTGEPSA